MPVAFQDLPYADTVKHLMIESEEKEPLGEEYPEEEDGEQNEVAKESLHDQFGFNA
jgi:hypothetical protein